jgi:protein-disulfide isomerase
MPSQKQSKRRRREARAAPPPVRVRTHARRQASPRVLIAAAALLVLVVVGIVLGVVLTSSGGGSSSSTGATLPGAADVQTLLRRIPQQGNVLGKSSAPVTMVEYVDLQCPFCQEFETQAMPTLISRYVRPGKLKVEARPIAIRGGDSFRGQSATIAAGRQNKLFNFMQLLYDNQGVENTGWLDDNMVKSAASSIPGLDVGLFLEQLNSSRVSEQVKTVDALSPADAVDRTPTILVGKTGTKARAVTITSANDPSAVAAAIDAALG